MNQKISLLFIIFCSCIPVDGNFEHTSSKETLQNFLLDLISQMLSWKSVIILENENQDVSLNLSKSLMEHGLVVTLLKLDQEYNAFEEITDAICNLVRCYGSTNVLILTSSANDSVLQILYEDMFFNSPHINWAIYSPDFDFVRQPIASAPDFVRLLEASPGKQNTSLFIARMIQHGKTLFLQEWIAGKGFLNKEPIVMKHLNPYLMKLGGRHLKVAMEKHFPFYEPLGYRGNTKADGSDILLLDSMARFLNFKYDIFRPPDGGWGRPNGSDWSGMIGMVMRNEVDIALSGMTMSYMRHEVVDFSVPYAFDRTTFVTKKPAQRSKTWAIFWPYTAQVWLCIALSTVVVSIFLQRLQNLMRDKMKKPCKKLYYTDAVTYLFQSLLSQGYYNASETSVRLLMSFWWIFAITIISGYNGRLMSFMANPGELYAIDTVPKMVDAILKGRLSVGTIKYSADHGIFRDSDEEDLKVILSNMESDPKNFVRHDVDGLAQSLRRSYAYVGGEMTVMADVWNPTLFLFAKDSFMQSGYAIAYRKGFLYEETFNRKIHQLRESGLTEKWISLMIKRNQTQQPLEDPNHVLNVYDVQGAFAVLGIGLLVSSCVFGLEMKSFKKSKILKRRRKKRRKIRKVEFPVTSNNWMTYDRRLKFDFR